MNQLEKTHEFRNLPKFFAGYRVARGLRVGQVVPWGKHTRHSCYMTLELAVEYLQDAMRVVKEGKVVHGNSAVMSAEATVGIMAAELSSYVEDREWDKAHVQPTMALEYCGKEEGS